LSSGDNLGQAQPFGDQSQIHNFQLGQRVIPIQIPDSSPWERIALQNRSWSFPDESDARRSKGPRYGLLGLFFKEATSTDSREAVIFCTGMARAQVVGFSKLIHTGMVKIYRYQEMISSAVTPSDFSRLAFQGWIPIDFRRVITLYSLSISTHRTWTSSSSKPGISSGFKAGVELKG
jgi:hypothetical protein